MFATTAGAGFEGLAFETLGGELVAGYRISRWVSIEGFFSFRYQTHPYRQSSQGAECSGTGTDLWHWETFGERVWIHLVHSTDLDFSIAPPGIAFGPNYDHERAQASGPFCAPVALDSASPIIDIALVGFAIEARRGAFGIRLTAQLSVPLSDWEHLRNTGTGALAVSAAAGPVLRF
jgi:hypothetical protein